MDTTEVVLKGVDLLNRYFGNEDWKTRIIVDNLDLNDSYDCVLGQLFGRYDRGADALESRFELPNRLFEIQYWPDDYGFCAAYNHSPRDLKEAWREQILDR